MAARERVIARSLMLVDGGPGVRFDVGGRDGRVPAFVIRFRGVVHAWRNVCAHQEVELDWQPGVFFDTERQHLICSLHGALYELDTGRCVAGPCRGDVLARITVEERPAAGVIVIAEHSPPGDNEREVADG